MAGPTTYVASRQIEPTSFPDLAPLVLSLGKVGGLLFCSTGSRERGKGIEAVSQLCNHTCWYRGRLRSARLAYNQGRHVVLALVE
jgi:hypothetical protein